MSKLSLCQPGGKIFAGPAAQRLRHAATATVLVLFGCTGYAQTTPPPSTTPASPPTCRAGDSLTVDAFAYCAASLIVRKSDASEVTEFFDAMALLAIAEGLVPKPKEAGQTAKLMLVTRQETKRTDKQLGSTARAQGSTTLAEKTGIEELLGLAIENGAIQQQVSGTTLTLTTSPYVLSTLRNGDTATNYLNHGDDLGRVGIAATFNISNQADILSNATRRQLGEWSVRIRLTGDNSTRSRGFDTFWQDKVADKISQPAIVLTGSERNAFKSIENRRRDIENRFFNTDPKQPPLGAGYIKDYLTGHSTLAGDDLINGLQAEILARLQADITIQVGSLGLDDKTKQTIVNETLPALVSAQQQAQQGIGLIQKEVQRLQTLGTATFEYTNVRDTTAGTYSNLKFLYEKGSSDTMKLVFNIGGSFYSDPNRDLNQQTTRDYATAVSWEGIAGRSPFALDANDQSQVTFSFSGRYQRLLENRHIAGKKADIAAAQGKVDLPILTGASLALSITYANADEMNAKEHVRFNFGVSYDTGKLYQLLQFNKQKAALMQ
jgi:hypothetical protein